MIVAAALLLAGERVVLGVWQRWAALRDSTPTRCFAIAQPLDDAGVTDRRGAFARIAVRRGPERAPAVFFRLSAPAAPGDSITLTIGERRFALSARDDRAFAADATTQRAIVGAIRGARWMTVTVANPGGGQRVDRYPLAGAPTAIDAAQLGCR